MKVVPVRIPQDMVEAADALAKQRKTDRSQLIRDALANLLDEPLEAA